MARRVRLRPAAERGVAAACLAIAAIALMHRAIEIRRVAGIGAVAEPVVAAAVREPVAASRVLKRAESALSRAHAAATAIQHRALVALACRCFRVLAVAARRVAHVRVRTLRAEPLGTRQPASVHDICARGWHVVDDEVAIRAPLAHRARRRQPTDPSYPSSQTSEPPACAAPRCWRLTSTRICPP